jgi:CDP-glucose 4,6-dehydratase
MVSGARPDPAFWRGRRVLLTGHTGFKGAWLSLWLWALGAELVGFSDTIPTAPSLFEDLHLQTLLRDRRGDVRDFEAVRAVVADSAPELVLHLAAQSLVRLSYDEPVSTYATNVMGTVHVLEAARQQADTRVVLVVTSDKCYENRDQIWGYRESDPMGGYDPYSSSKGCAELVTAAYARSFQTDRADLRILSGRAGNVIGGGDWAADRLVPDLVRGLARNQSVPIRNPDAIRPWQHVLEPLCGYLLLCEQAWRHPEVAAQGWNFGPDAESEIPVRAVADKVCALWRREHGWHAADAPGQRHEANLLRLDSTKARSRLGWRPHWTIDQALAASVAVYASDVKGDALRSLLHRQIADYTGQDTSH